MLQRQSKDEDFSWIDREEREYARRGVCFLDSAR